MVDKSIIDDANNTIKGKYNIDDESASFENIKTLNRENETKHAVFKSKLDDSKKKIQEMIKDDEYLKSLVDIDRLGDKEYILSLKQKFVSLFEQSKIQYNIEKNNALRELSQ